MLREYMWSKQTATTTSSTQRSSSGLLDTRHLINKVQVAIAIGRARFKGNGLLHPYLTDRPHFNLHLPTAALRLVHFSHLFWKPSFRGYTRRSTPRHPTHFPDFDDPALTAQWLRLYIYLLDCRRLCPTQASHPNTIILISHFHRGGMPRQRTRGIPSSQSHLLWAGGPCRGLSGAVLRGQSSDCGEAELGDLICCTGICARAG